MMEFWHTKLDMNKAIIGQETHKNGGKHMHGIAYLNEKLRSSDVRLLDYKGYHPNLAAMKNPKECLDYCTKEAKPEDIEQFNMDYEAEA